MGEIVVVKAEDYGLDVEKAKEIELGFAPAIERLNNLKPEYDAIVQKEVCPEVCEEAKELRLKFVKVRTDTGRIHKALKAFYLAGGRFVGAWKNKQTEISEQVENRLKEIEEHYERIELAKKEARKAERIKELTAIENTGEGIDLLNMDESLYQTVLTGLRKEYTDRKEAERLAQEEATRLEAERKAEQERIRQENERLRKEQEEKDKAMAAERAKAAAEKKKLEDEIARQKQEQEKREAAERAKVEEERKEKARLARAGDKAKITAFFAVLSDKPTIKNPELAQKFNAIISLIDEICK